MTPRFKSDRAALIAFADDAIKPPYACVKLAKLYGFTAPESFTREQAEAALAQLNLRMILVPEARRCRAAIIMEMKK